VWLAELLGGAVMPIEETDPGEKAITAKL